MLHSFCLTCCRDPGEDPALPVRDRLTIGRVVLPQDLHAAAPRRRRHPIRVIAWPVAHQDAEVILGVYLRGATRLINQTRRIERFFAHLLDLFHKFIWERVLSECLLREKKTRVVEKPSVCQSQSLQIRFLYSQLSQLVTAQCFLFVRCVTRAAVHLGEHTLTGWKRIRLELFRDGSARIQTSKSQRSSWDRCWY